VDGTAQVGLGQRVAADGVTIAVLFKQRADHANDNCASAHDERWREPARCRTASDTIQAFGALGPRAEVRWFERATMVCVA